MNHARLILSILLFFQTVSLLCPFWGQADNHQNPDRIFLEGKKAYDSGRLNEARSTWKAISKDELYGPVVYLLIASKYMDSKKYSLAESHLKEFLKAHPSTPYKSMALSIVIDCQLEQGKKEVGKLIQSQLNKADDYEKPVLTHKLANLELKSGNYDVAVRQLRKLVIDYPASVDGLRAWEQLSELTAQHKITGLKLTDTEEQTRGDKLFRAGKFDLAAESYKRLNAIKPDDKNIKFKLARSLYKNRDNQEAIKVLTKFLDSKVSAEEETEANYLLSLIYWRLDKEREFELSCKKTLDKGAPKFKRRVIANLAAHSFERGDLTRAENYYRKLLSQTNDSLVKADIEWKLAWIRYRSGQFKEAADLFAECRKLSTNGKLANPSKYWEARSLAQAGSNSVAENLLKEVAPARKNDYYSIEASRLLGIKNMEIKKASASSNAPVDTQLTQNQSNLKEVKFALALMEKDLPEFALANLKSLPQTTRKTPGIALLTATAAHNCGFYGMAHDILFSQFGAMVDNPPETAPPYFLSLAYPKPHYSYTLRQSALRGVDPFLVWSIIRQESRYDSSAISPAGAIGLMQVTPDTARKLNSYRPRNNSKLIADVLDPRLNISAGVEILANNLKTFGGNVVAAIAAYNADPKKVKDWIRRNGKMKQDEFIENIPFLETRLYVKRVLANMAVYKKIHGRTDMAERW